MADLHGGARPRRSPASTRRAVAPAHDAGALPNPPELFEGRAAELERLGRRLGSSPVTVVCGPAGIGKTGLVLRAIAASALPAVYVDGFDGERPALVGLVRTLAVRAARACAPDLGRAESPALVSLALELAEATGGVVVLDDVPTFDEGSSVEGMLRRAARVGRALRLVAIGRMRPAHADLADKTLALGALDDASIRSILSGCGVAEASDEMVALAAGSPARARRAALRGGAVEPSIASRLGAEARAVLDAMRVCSVPLRLPDAVHRELDREGLTRAVSGGVVLEASARALVESEPFSRVEAGATARRLLAATPGAPARVEAVRLAVEAGDANDVESLLAPARTGIFDAGASDALFAALGERDASLDVHRFACASFRLGGPAFTWAVAAPRPERPALRLVWAQILAHGGELERAREAAEELADGDDEEVREHAQLLLGDVLRHAGALDASIARLTRMEPTTPATARDRDYRLAAALAARGDAESATSLLTAWADAPAGAEADPAGFRRVRHSLGSALLVSSRFRDLERLLGPREPPVGASTTDLYLHVATATERGRWVVARRLLERLGAMADETAQLRFIVRFTALRIALATGPHEGLAAKVHALVFERSLEVPELVAWSLAAKAAVDVTCAPGATLEVWPASVGAPPPPAAALLAAHGAILEARRGGRVRFDVDGAAFGADVGLVVERAHAEVLLAAGLTREAEDALQRGLERARREGLVIEELALLALRLDLRVIAIGEHEAAPSLAVSAANELHDRAEALGAVRYADEAFVALWLLGRGRTRDELAPIEAASASAVARRRARALVAGEAALDALDARFVSASTSGLLPGSRAPIVVDVERRIVTLPSGADVDLSAQELHLRMLEVLARGHGRATKEDLVLRAWGLPRYSKLRDDKRLQVAVHRLRKRLEIEPAAPTLLVRDGDGYRVTVPMRLGRPDPNA